MSETIGKLLCAAQRRLQTAGIDEAKLEARLLVAAALGTDPAGLIACAHDAIGPEASARVEPFIARRAAREPLAHILGETEFHRIRLFSDARALIPRSDSETVVELALEVLPPGRTGHVADLGTGSGCLLLALLAARPDLTGEGVEASAGAIALARENAGQTGLSGRARFVHASWSDWTGWDAADLILSNPPYIRSEEIAGLQPEVRDHEPRAALDGGPDGLAAYREIIALAAAGMRTGAWLVLEIGHDQDEAVSALLQAASFADLLHRRDLGGNSRAIAARTP